MQMIFLGQPGYINLRGGAPINSATPVAGRFHHPANKGYGLSDSAVAPAVVETSTFAKAAADEMAGRKASASAKATADRMADKAALAGRRARSERFASSSGETHKWRCHNGLRSQSAEDGGESACYLQVVEYEQVELKMNVSIRKTQVPAGGREQPSNGAHPEKLVYFAGALAGGKNILAPKPCKIEGK
jgi:hypothetical protein